MGALGLDIVDFVTVGIECTLRQLLEAGFFHAGAPPPRSCPVYGRRACHRLRVCCNAGHPTSQGN